MTWWPWVSRRAYDEVARQRDEYAVLNRDLLDHLKRMDRVRLGRPETPVKPKPARPDLPRGLVDLIAGFGSEATRRYLEEGAYRKLEQGLPVTAVIEEIQASVGALGVGLGGKSPDHERSEAAK